MDFSSLIAWLQSVWKEIWVFRYVRDYEEGILFNRGRFRKILKPGLHFKWSVIEEVHIYTVVDDTILLPPQPLTTKDHKTITVNGMVLYRIEDVRKWGTDVNEPKVTLTDIAMGVIAKNIIERDYVEMNTYKTMNEVTKQVRNKAKKYGAYVESVEFTSLSLSKTLNITNHIQSHL